MFERAACDAEWLGDLDGPIVRAVQDITPAIRTRVLARDGHRCRVPGCRSSRNIEVHHIVHREHGGSHELSNLIALCTGHHAAHHEGRLIIRGTADALDVSFQNFHVENSEEKSSEVATMRADAILALTTMGFKKGESSAAVAAAMGEHEPRDLDALLRAALRRCGR